MWLRAFLWLPLAFGCAHLPPAAPPPSATYAVTAILASPGHMLTSTYRVAVRRGGGSAVEFQTIASRVIVEDEGKIYTWDSATPDPREPWVVTQERRVSSVPVAVVLDERGRPAFLADEARWRAEVAEALDALALPEQARASAEAILDPKGVVLGLARDFPGAPGIDGTWVRVESIGDREILREERCVVEGARWTCEGTAKGSGLESGTSRTVLVLDEDGLVELDARWDAVAFANAPGGAVGRKVVAGRRVVTREPR